MLKVANKHYTWDELVKLYPDKWVVVENAKLTRGGFIQEGELIAVGDQREIDDFIVECYKADRKILCLFDTGATMSFDRDFGCDLVAYSRQTHEK